MADRDRERARRTNGRAIRGPHSALTDFLASHNISAVQIERDHQLRITQARQQAAQDAQTAQTARTAASSNGNASDDDVDPAERAKRRRKEQKALEKIKQSKEFQHRKSLLNNADADADYDDNENDAKDDRIAREIMATRRPGQLENCELCGKRFTVTPYNKAGPNGGLLCTKCSKELKDDEKKEAAANKKKAAAPRSRKRQTESDRMMGDVKPGAKSLLDACVRKVANIAHDIDDFGEMPQNVLDRLSQILSKRRVLDSRTLDLFLREDVDRIVIYDAARLEKEDFQRIFARMPQVEIVNLRFAGQLKDPVFLYMVDKCRNIRHLQLGATNLISDPAWVKLFQTLGPQLESLKLSELNDALTDETMAEMVKHCKNLKRMKMRSCSYVTEVSIGALAQLTSLEHLTLSVAKNTPSATLCSLIAALGRNLRTLCLERFTEIDDAVLSTIQANCNKLVKLRLTGSASATDAAFAELFGNNSCLPPLTEVDLSDNRDMDPDPNDMSTSAIGFGSAAAASLLTHSARTLQVLNLKSSRHISLAALLEAFDGKPEKFPALREMDLSFVAQLDDVVMIGIFRSCPALQKLVVFACFNARAARIPPGIAVIGLPNAMNNIIQEGNWDVEMTG